MGPHPRLALDGIDERDRRILYELDSNSRQSVSRIARRLKLDKGVVAYRIRRMEREGIIRDYYAVIDLSKLGFFGIRAYLKLTSANFEEEKQIIQLFARDKHTWWVGSMDGVYSLCAGFYMRNTSEFHEFWNRFEERYHHLLSNTVIAIYNGAYDLNYAFLAPEKPRTCNYVGLSKPVETTKSELSVLREISENARMPTTQIAERTGLAPITVQKSIRALKEKGVILGFRIGLDLGKLGLTYYKLNAKVNDYSQLKKMKEYALSDPRVLCINEVIGYGDFELDIAARSYDDFKQLFDDIKTRFPRTIRDAEYFVYGTVHKTRYTLP